MSDEPKLEEFKTHKKYKSDIFDKYDLKKACLHDRHIKMTILQANRKRRPGLTTHDDLPAYFVGVSTKGPMDRQSYILLKGPTSKWHVKRCWNYIDNFCSVTPPTDPEDRQHIRTSILWASNNERLFRVFPTVIHWNTSESKNNADNSNSPRSRSSTSTSALKESITAFSPRTPRTRQGRG